MKRSTIASVALGAACIAAIGWGAYRWGMKDGMGMAAAPTAESAPKERKVLYWHDPMVPGSRFDKPGKSPFMDMQLVPVYADEAPSDSGAVQISPRVEQNLGIRTVAATKAALRRSLSVAGSIAYDERELALVQARANGFLERLYVRAPLDRVTKGEPLAELLVPDWVAAQEEFLAVDRMSEAGLETLREGARQRMRLAGMSEDQIALVARTRQVHARMTLVAPLSGAVTELSAREGMTVMAGAPLFRINGLGTVWVNAEVPEGAAASVRPGTPVSARSAAFPGKAFEGKVGALLPQVSAATRTITARIEIANPRGELTPGMFVTVDLEPAARADVVQVPSEAVIRTGKRTVVIVADTADGGRTAFRPVEVETGAEAGGMTEIRRGLEAGSKVVASGQFLIDSEANLKAATERMGGDAAATAQAGGPRHEPPAEEVAYHATGTVERIGESAITLSHEPIPELKWPAMTMDFAKPPQGLAAGIKPGARVHFQFVQRKDGGFELRSIEPMGGAR
jgi:Cu(I)/Ag(I) efflux system membrane fusion protein